MVKYDFKNVFIKYVILLSVIMMFMYVCIIMVFSWQVNSEIKESSSNQFDSLKSSLNDKELINKGTSYFIMKDGKIIHNRTDISNEVLNSQIIQKNKQSFNWKNNSKVYHINYGKLSDGSILYSFTNVSDYEETKQLLYNLLVLLFIVTVILIVGAAYYIAIKPVRAYEEMLDQHKKFIQNASHELKTPIASLSLGVDYINAADGSKLSEKSQNALSKMKKEIYYAQSLIIKTLNIDDRNKQIENINISKILDDIIEQQYHLKGIHIQKHYEPSLLHKIDSVMFTQMVTILVDNAIKHNNLSVQVEVSALKSKDGLTLVVQDNGIGIQPEQVEKIFNRHYKVNKASDGSGIGLDILKNLVSEVNGTLEVQSEPNKKTRFILNL